MVKHLLKRLFGGSSRVEVHVHTPDGDRHFEVVRSKQREFAALQGVGSPAATTAFGPEALAEAEKSKRKPKRKASTTSRVTSARKKSAPKKAAAKRKPSKAKRSSK